MPNRQSLRMRIDIRMRTENQPNPYHCAESNPAGRRGLQALRPVRRAVKLGRWSAPPSSRWLNRFMRWHGCMLKVWPARSVRQRTTN
jgi:hypothetical protein